MFHSIPAQLNSAKVTKLITGGAAGMLISFAMLVEAKKFQTSLHPNGIPATASRSYQFHGIGISLAKEP